MRLISFSNVALFATVAGLFAAPAAADEPANFALERFRPAQSREGLLDVEWGGVGRHLDADASLFMHYGWNPLVLHNGSGDRVGSLVEHRIGGHVQGVVSLFDWIQVGAELPVVAFQSRDSAALAGIADGAQPLLTTGIGDVRLIPKLRILRAEDQFVDVAVLFPVHLPSGTPKASYLSDDSVGLAPELAVSRALGGLRLAANVGYRARLRDDVTFLDVTSGHEVFWRGGAGFRFHDLINVPLETTLTVSGATLASAPFTSGPEENPLEAILAGAYDVGLVTLYGGVGAGLIGGYGTPDLRVLGGVRFAARDTDKDDDGVEDKDDRCPEVAEDLDGFEDKDGCPDEDNDKDGILDDVDGVEGACADSPEDTDGFEDQDGCPDDDNDKDGVLDSEDKCRDEPGLAKYEGCPMPDRDGDTVEDSQDKCPDEAGPVERDGCPDRDGDGVLDAVDRCPDVPGLKAFKGCIDTDGDGFADPDDKCPNEAEIINGVEDDDGCPDKGASKVKITKEKIEILETVFFDTGKATIQARSNDLLKQVAAVMRNNAQLTKVRVEGHTDDRGDDAFNMTLSQQRAESVKTFLTTEGVDATRLEATGYGETRPVGDNKNSAGREQNRRVEFVIIEVDGQAVQAASSVEVEKREVVEE